MQNLSKINKLFKNKTILITGGTGSFGSKFIQKILSVDCKIIIFSRDELKQYEQRIDYNKKNIKFIIGDIRDRKSINDAMKDVDYVFHAAALKQVPSCEFFPDQAINTNVNGSINVIDAAVNNKVKSIVLLSTDKAVYPINSMGMTKALMEKISLAKARVNKKNQTTISIVRYGNVMMSRGSVIPLFIDQIKNEKDITITNNKMTRFLMPLDKAIDLVFLAIIKNNNGSIFIHKAKSMNILDLANNLKKIFKSKSKIKMIGTRHGEKIHEVLATSEELQFAKKYQDYFEIKMQNSDLNYNKYFTIGKNLNLKKDFTSENSKKMNFKELSLLIKKELNKININKR